MDPTLENLIGPIATWIGMQPTTLLFYLGILVMLTNVVSRLIPDDATGVLGWVRSAAGWIGLHFPNRITGNLNTNDVAALILAQKGYPIGEARVQTAQDKADNLTPTSEPMELTQAAPTTVHPQMFAGVGRDPDTGKFKKLESPMWVGLLAMLCAVMLLSGCVTQRTQAGAYACAHADQIRAADPIARLKIMTIQDPLARQAALAGLDLTLAALATCPVSTTIQGN